MKLSNYFPTFRNVLIKEVKEDKTEGGIYIPSSAFKPQEEKLYEVIKTGVKCEEVTWGDKVKLTQGIPLNPITLDKEEYFQVYEQQIIGYFRK